MDQSEFPSLTSTDEKSLSSSWADVAKSQYMDQDANKDASMASNNIIDNHTYAEVAGHEKKLEEEFPTPNQTTTQVTTNIVPPNPDRSFADVASNKGFPKPEKDSKEFESLSDLPDVKDMLNQPSVRVPPVPPNQSFAKIAAKEIPPEKRPLSERAQNIIQNQPPQEEESFPTLEQSTLMSNENAKHDEKELYSEISKFHQLGNDNEKVESNLKKSFADITGSNLENAPPSAVSHVDQYPVYDEETVYLENAKRDSRKHVNVERGNNNQLIEEEELQEIEPTKEQRKQEKINEKIQVVEKREKANNLFVKNDAGRITIFQTMSTLYRLGYSWLSIIPGAILMHLRLSPMTSPYSFPFIYRNPLDLILLPIYTKNLNRALSYQLPMIDNVNQISKKYEHGLSYNDGFQVLRTLEKDSLRWYQLGLWVVHRIQWTLTYTMLHDPKANVVTISTLKSLSF